MGFVVVFKTRLLLSSWSETSVSLHRLLDYKSRVVSFYFKNTIKIHSEADEIMSTYLCSKILRNSF